MTGGSNHGWGLPAKATIKPRMGWIAPSVVDISLVEGTAVTQGQETEATGNNTQDTD